MFQRRVADAYRALGYQVAPNVSLQGQQVDLVARRHDDGGPGHILDVECKDHRAPVGNQAVQDFVSSVTALRAADAVTAGVIVSASGFTSPARAVADRLPYITLLSWDELASQLFNVRLPMQTLVAAYEHSAIHRDYLDIPADVTSSDGSFAPQVPHVDTVSSVVAAWLHASVLRKVPHNAHSPS